MVCIASRNGRIQRWARSLAASTMPSGRPITIQNASEVSTSDSVTMASDQMPSMATTSSEATAPKATARPANCHASRPSNATMASVGTPVSRPSTQVSVPSIGARTVWKKGRKFSTTQPSPSLIHDSMGKEPSHSCWMCQPLDAASVLSKDVVAACSGASSQLPLLSVASLPAGAAPHGSALSVVAAVEGASDAAAGKSQGVTAAPESPAVAQGSVSAGGGSAVGAGVCSASVMRSSFLGRGFPQAVPRAEPAGCRGPETSATWFC